MVKIIVREENFYMKKCPDCGGSVSDRMSSCPTCGAPIAKKSDRYSQFYQKPQTFLSEPRYEEHAEQPRQKKSSKSTALSILAILISFMAFLTSFIAIAIASSKQKEVVADREVPVYLESDQSQTIPDVEEKEVIPKNIDSEEKPVEKQNQYQGKEKNNVVYEEELYKDENIVISYNKITENSYGGYDIDFVIENYSSRTLEVQARETSINGYMVNPICSIEIAPNKKAVDGMSIGGVDAERVPLKEISDIETKFHIIDWNDDAFNYDTGNITIKRND